VRNTKYSCISSLGTNVWAPEEWSQRYSITTCVIALRWRNEVVPGILHRHAGRITVKWFPARDVYQTHVRCNSEEVSMRPNAAPRCMKSAVAWETRLSTKENGKQ
jgi:hypothetical protein